MGMVMELVNFYENQLKKTKKYYQADNEDLREEIQRQYKVIALMKQEVEDLMELIKGQKMGDLF